MHDHLPPHHTIIEQADNSDGTVTQTVQIAAYELDGYTASYQRVVHADEAYGWEPEYAYDITYQTMLRHIVAHGTVRPDRTGTGTTGVFGYQCRFDLSQGYFPLLTLKQMNGRDWNNIVVELVWFLRGQTNIRFLLEHDVHIWTDWPYKRFNAVQSGFADAQQLTRAQFEQRIVEDPEFAEQWGDCGPIYGKQWRAWSGGVTHLGQPLDLSRGSEWITSGDAHNDACEITQITIDQLQQVFNELATNPFSRRHIVSAWNPADIPAMIPAGLPPCHCLFQFNVRAMTTEQRCAVAKQRPVEDYGGAYPTTEDGCDQCAIPRYALDCQLYQRSQNERLH